MPLRLFCLIVVVSMGLGSTGIAQPTWQWAQRGFASGRFDAVYGESVAVGKSGNVYLAGRFSGTATFGDPNLPLKAEGVGGAEDVLVAKYDPTGRLLWARRFGGAGSDAAHAVAIDNDENIFIAGRYAAFTGPVAFDSFVLTNLTAGFVAKLEPAAGQVLWARDGGQEWFGLAVDSQGQAHVTGQAQSLQLVGTKLAGPIALAKYSASGNLLWKTNSLGSLFAGGNGRGIAVDAAGNVFVTGRFTQSIEFGAAALRNATPPNGSTDEMFLAKFNASGAPVWAQRGGGAGKDVGNAIGVDAAGEVVVVGTCDDVSGGSSVACDIGGVTFPGALGGGLGNMFLARFRSDGSAMWVRKIPQSSRGAGIHVQSNGEFVVCGQIQSVAPVDIGGVTLSKPWVGGTELFVAKYDAAGSAVWGRVTSSTLPGDHYTLSVAQAADGSVYEAGNHTGANSVVFDATVLGSTTTGSSLHLARLAPPDPVVAFRVSGLSFLPSARIQLTLTSPPGRSVAVEVGSDLRNWTPVFTGVPVGGAVEFADPAASLPFRFFRVTLN